MTSSVNSVTGISIHKDVINRMIFYATYGLINDGSGWVRDRSLNSYDLNVTTASTAATASALAQAEEENLFNVTASGFDSWSKNTDWHFVSNVTLGVLMSILVAISILGNILVITAIWTDKSLRKVFFPP